MAITGYPSPGNPPGTDAQDRRWGRGWPYCSEAGALQKTVTLINGIKITVRQEIAELTRCLLNYCLARGYQIRPADTGGYNCRPIRNSDPPRPSNHSWGLAIDVNWTTNVQYTTQTDIPLWMVSLLWAYGFYWGGWYVRGSEDPMHFEFIKRPADVGALTRDAQALWEEIMSEAQTNALAFNTASMLGALVEQRTTAPQKDWQDPGIGNASPSIALPLVTTIVNTASAVTALGTQLDEIEAKIETPAPVQVDVAELAAALRPIILQVVAEVLSSVNVEILVPASTP